MSKLYRIVVVVAVCTFSSGARCETWTPSSSYIESSTRLPEWNLSDLDTSLESEALASDLREAKMLCQTFANYYKDKLQKIAERPDGANEIAKAIERYDQITDRIGRIYPCSRGIGPAPGAFLRVTPPGRPHRREFRNIKGYAAARKILETRSTADQ
jgi:hypothetical protein